MKCSPATGTGSEVQSIIKIEQAKLDCGTYLTPKASGSVTLTNDYVIDGAKATYGISNFFDLSTIPGCINSEKCEMISATDFTNCNGPSPINIELANPGRMTWQ